ncbi:hypothetical protein BTA51_04795 [Hahella sp. CCB-MM4]|uniref:hypothetical protein n=1 Tax=Hahella sp. (strain CCB-MM4) TaxID=1926491 RepID=UPI000B9A208A|nr:hypothetical protein [Hahella sp. CCB-MM4]OZG74333.1 hypothetical protein BTA51_04795 [Hahella sp. CCB-MM4]
MSRVIGMVVQPRVPIMGSGQNKDASFLKSVKELFYRAGCSFQGRSRQGFFGALAASYAGHTLLHGKNTARPMEAGEGRPEPASISTGFSPDGLLGSLKIWLFNKLGRPNATAIGAVHNETGVMKDPKAMAVTIPVGAGLYAAFENYQQRLVGEKAPYSWRPNGLVNDGTQQRTENCVTKAIDNMSQFIQTAKAHGQVMEQLQEEFQLNPLSKNQAFEAVNLDRMEEFVGDLRDHAVRSAHMGTGNQKILSQHFKDTGEAFEAAHSAELAQQEHTINSQQ